MTDDGAEAVTADVCAWCARTITPVPRLADGWEDEYKQMVCPATDGRAHQPKVPMVQFKPVFSGAGIALLLARCEEPVTLAWQSEAMTHDYKCLLCGELSRTRPLTHGDMCPWRLAAEWAPGWMTRRARRQYGPALDELAES